MEIRSIGQGGQVNIDTSKNFDIGNSSNNVERKVQSSNDTGNRELASKEKNYNEKDIKKAIGKLNKFLEDDKTHAEYEVHDKLKDIMIKIVDDNTGKVIQELPPKKILDMIAKMCEMVGIIFDKKA